MFIICFQVNNERNQGLLKDIGLWPANMAHNVDYWIKNFNVAIQYSNDNQLFEEKSLKQQDRKK